MMKRKLLIRDLTLRDGQQSAFATRMNQSQIDRVLPYYKDANFYATEVWGGAVSDSVMRYLNENPGTDSKKLAMVCKVYQGLQRFHVEETCTVTLLIPMKLSMDFSKMPLPTGLI